MSAAPIYLDYHAAAPVAPLAFEAMRPYFTERFGDPGQTLHAHGWTADAAIDVARGQLGLLLNAEAAGFVFTSPMAEIAEVAHSGGAFLLADATWAVGKVPVDVDAADVDLLAFNANQFYGPKGTGGLWVRRRPRRVRLLPELTGAGQQDGLRSGHYNVPGIVGMGKAADLADERLAEEAAYLERLRDRFEATITTSFADVTVNGAESPRVPTVSNLTIPGTETRKLLPLLRGVAASTGAACKTRASQPSRVLTAMGRSRAEAFASLRFSFGRYTTEAEVDAAARAVIEDAGYGAEFRHRLGHGIGMDVHEAPFLTKIDHTPVVEGMMFTIEPSITQFNTFSARVEDVVVARPGGGEPLTTGYQSLIVVE